MTGMQDIDANAFSENAAATWCVRLKTGGRLSRDEDATLQSWFESDPGSERRLADCLEAWEALGTVSDAPEMVAFRAEALDQMRRANRRRWRRTARPPLFAYAMVVLAVALFGLGAWNMERDSPRKLSTDLAERRAVLLDDGSHVSLDARSRITVSLSRGQRQLALDEGRAKFDVAHDSTRPFTVQVGEHIVVATGTSFSTELLNGKLHVILYRGRVVIVDGKMPAPETLLALRAHPETGAIALNPGQEFVGDANRTGGVVRPNPPRSLSWEHGSLDFDDEPLSDVVAQLNRYSADTIIVRNSKAAGIRVSGVFEEGKSRSFLEGLADVYPVKIAQSGEHRFEITM